MASSPSARDELVLVVDDDPVSRAVLSRILEDGGFAVIQAADAAGALEAACGWDLDLVLLDRQLPDGSGLDVLRRLRGQEPTRALPIVMVTADDAGTDVARALEAGANDYVVKPFDAVALLARVRAQLRNRALWATEVEGRFERRSAVARRLARLGSVPSRPVTLAFCQELLGLEDVAGALLVTKEGADLCLLASAGLQPWVPERSCLPAPVAGPLWHRVISGPCDVSDLVAGRSAVAVAAPILANDRVVGVLVVSGAPDASSGPLTHGGLIGVAADFGVVASALFGAALDGRAATAIEIAYVEQVLRRRSYNPVFQPVCDLTDGRPVGYEALTRFDDGAPPEVRFAAAAAVGFGPELELAAINAAVAASARLGDGCWVSLNVSPGSVGQALDDVLREADHPLVLELTEHDRVDDYDALRSRISRLSAAPALSVDDAGAGFASLSHVLALRPDFMKLDRAWVTSIDRDATRQALVAGLVHFAGATGCQLIAEGIERREELDMLRQLGVGLGQGFLLGRPTPI